MSLSPQMRVLVATGVVALLLTAFGVARHWLPYDGIVVTFENRSTTPIASITVDYGSADRQGEHLLLRLDAGERRRLALNHPPAAGFNVVVRFADGETIEFCANRGVEARYQQVPITR